MNHIAILWNFVRCWFARIWKICVRRRIHDTTSCTGRSVWNKWGSLMSTVTISPWVGYILFTKYVIAFNWMCVCVCVSAGVVPTNFRSKTIQSFGRTAKEGRRYESHVCVACQGKGGRTQRERKRGQFLLQVNHGHKFPLFTRFLTKQLLSFISCTRSLINWRKTTPRISENWRMRGKSWRKNSLNSIDAKRKWLQHTTLSRLARKIRNKDER